MHRNGSWPWPAYGNPAVLPRREKIFSRAAASAKEELFVITREFLASFEHFAKTGMSFVRSAAVTLNSEICPAPCR